MYGVTIASDHQFDVVLPRSDADPDVVFELTEENPDESELDLVEPVYSEGRRLDGRPDYEFYALEDRDVVRIVAALDFHCFADRIVCRVREPRERYLVEIALFGMVMSLWLERRGIPTLHASAVEIDSRAVAFLTRRGGGKTSSAAACVAAGYPLVSDDLLAIEEVSDRFLACPGYPQFRMWPEQATHFVGSAEGLPTFRPGYDKRRVTVGLGFGAFTTASRLPLARLYVPHRTGDPDGEVSITPLPPRQAALTLVRETFLPREVVRYGFQAQRLSFFARLVAAVPVSRLTVPEGLDQLPRVVAGIEADVHG